MLGDLLTLPEACKMILAQELNGCLLDGHRMSVRLMERLPRDTADNCRLFVGNLPEEAGAVGAVGAVAISCNFQFDDCKNLA